MAFIRTDATFDDIIAVCEDNEWRADLYSQSDRRGGTDTFIELETWTDSTGEDVIITIWGNTPQEMVDYLEEYVADFDPEEYEEGWLNMSKEERVKKGAPESVYDILRSGEEVQEMVTNLLVQINARLGRKSGSRSRKSGRGC